MIVTADDVGLHEGMNAGAVTAHHHGIVTACSVVANGRALMHAVELLKDCPRLSAGAHLTLVEEKPLSSEAEVRSLVGSDGRFHSDFRAFAARYALGRIRISEVERELRAQIDLLTGSGLGLTHLNGHQHLHVLPRIFDLVLRLADEYGIGYVRIPTASVPAGTAWSRSVSMRVLSGFGENAARRSKRGSRARTVGIPGAGHMSASGLVALIEELDGGDVELVSHPGTETAMIAESYDWGYDWDQETAALCDPAVRAAIARRGIQLITPEDLKSS
jgi:chitin disaccharide deacetylase